MLSNRGYGPRRQAQRDPFEDDDPFTAIMQAQQRRMQQLQQMMNPQMMRILTQMPFPHFLLVNLFLST